MVLHMLVISYILPAAKKKKKEEREKERTF